MRKIFAIGIILLATAGCTPKQVLAFKTAVVCHKAHMVHCVAKEDKYGMYQVYGEKP